MPNYREIFNQFITDNKRERLAENSSGLRQVTRAADQLTLLSGRTLDIGCGLGFVVEYLTSPSFNLKPFGCDVSDETVVRAIERTKHIPGLNQRFYATSDQTLPFKDDFFGVISCFDVLQHLEESDMDATLAEVQRVARAKTVFLGSVVCDESPHNDQFGDNLNRSVQSPDWWIAKIAPDRIEFDCNSKQLTWWKRFDAPTPAPKPTNSPSENG
jgi:SAM-dependent methyltransferase